MTAQIRPNRMEVSDRFPMLGFAVRTDQPDVDAEVVIASDIGLFNPVNRQQRTAANFYSSREHGTLTVPRGEGVFVVPPDVLARFIGSEKLYFGLATGRKGNGGLHVDALPREGSPYVSLRGFTGRTLRRGFGGNRASTPKLDWTGDTPKPGSEAANGHGGTSTNGNGAPTPPATSGAYDDGFGPMPAIPAMQSGVRGHGVAPRATPYRGITFTPAHQLGLPQGTTGITMSSGTTAQQALDWIREKAEAVVDAVGSEVTPPSLYRLGSDSETFVSVWEKVLGAASWLPGAGGIYGFLKVLPQLARTSDVTLSVGPALDTPLFGGGVGVVFAPDGQVALFGQGDINLDLSGLTDFVTSLKATLQAKLKLGYNHSGIDGFASMAKVAGIAVGAEIVVGAECWLDGNGHGLGGAVSVGGGFALQLAAQEAEKSIVMPQLPGDARERARRIGGEFAPRIGEALDLGLDPAALTPLLDKLDAPATAVPLGYARPMSGPWSVHWDDVHVIPQPTGKGCWATTIAMLMGWRDQMSYDPAAIAQQCGRDIANGLPWAERDDVARALGLGTVTPQCYTPEGFRSLIEQHGPLYVGKIMSDTIHSGHAVLATGMYFDGTDHYVRVADPWDRGAGSPGAPDPYSRTHSTGSLYIMKFDTFMHEYEMAAAGTPAYVQIIYAGIPAGRSINTSTAAPSGYAMGSGSSTVAKPRRRNSTQLGIGAVAGELIKERIIDGADDVEWNLEQFKGIKHPNDVAPATVAPFRWAPTIKIRDWERGMLMDCGADFDIKFQYNGTAISNVEITNVGFDDSHAWKMKTTATITGDNGVYDNRAGTLVLVDGQFCPLMRDDENVAGADMSRQPCAALRIRVEMNFTQWPVGGAHKAIIDFVIFGDGTHARWGRWVQEDIF